MKVELTKDKFNRREFTNTVDTKFTELTKEESPSFFDLNLATIGDFFLLYNKFFYQIPKTGVAKSHQFLIDESSSYIGTTSENNTILELTNQIAELEQEIIDLTTN